MTVHTQVHCLVARPQCGRTLKGTEQSLSQDPKHKIGLVHSSLLPASPFWMTDVKSCRTSILSKDKTTVDSSALMTIYALTARSREQSRGTFLGSEKEETAMEKFV